MAAPRPFDQDAYLSRMNHGGDRTGHLLRCAARYGMMIAVAALMLGPFLWLAYLSVRTAGGIHTWPRGLSDFSFESYPVVWTQFRIGRAMLASFATSLTAVAITVTLASLAAYPLARFDFYGREIVFLAMLSTLMMPFQLYMIPLFLQTTKGLRWLDGLVGFDRHPALAAMAYYGAVVLPASASVFGVYLIRQFYSGIPKELEEAGRVDGAGEFRLWWQLMFPMTKPAVATLAIFTFVGSWSNFLWPLLVLPEEYVTLPVALATLTGAFVDRVSYLAAGSVLAIAPVVAFFLALQRFFLGGMTSGAVKG